MKPKVIVFFISTLGVGGAEMMLLKLITRLRESGLLFKIVTIGTDNPLSESFKNLGVEITELEININPLVFFRVIRKIKDLLGENADYTFQGWMYHGNLLSHIMKLFFKPKHHYIAIRQTLPDISNQKKLTQLIIRLDAFLSRWADKTLYVAQAAVPQHLAVGYEKKNIQVIPNGFDLENFFPNIESREKIRKIYNLNQKDFVVGHVARFHPMKDHQSFIKSINQLMFEKPNLKVILIGKDVTIEKFQKDISSENIERFIFAGEQKNLNEWNNAFDLAVSSSSYGEGFSNAIGEAMACGVPCLVTDVGDSAWIVDSTGYVVPPYRTDLLEEKMRIVISNREELIQKGKNARARMVKHFSIEAICQKYFEIW